MVNSFAGFYKNTLMRNQVNSKKREKLVTERERWRQELEEEVARGERAQHNAELELQLRLNEEMTVADILRIGRWAIKSNLYQYQYRSHHGRNVM